MPDKAHHVLYPQYIDATLLPSQGRCTTLQHAVQKPTLQEMFEALKAMGFQTVFADPVKSLPCAQSQAYCVPPLRGCIKVKILEPLAPGSGPNTLRVPVLAAYPNKASVLRAVADRIAAIPDRPVYTVTRAQAMSTAQASAGATAMARGANKSGKVKQKRVRM